jgi:hypothetical protein
MRGVSLVANSLRPAPQRSLPFSRTSVTFLGLKPRRSGERAHLHLGQAVAVTLLGRCLIAAFLAMRVLGFGEFVHAKGWRACGLAAN